MESGEEARMVDKVGDRVDVGKVLDDDGLVREGKEAVAVSKEHFEEVLNGGEEMGEVW